MISRQSGEGLSVCQALGVQSISVAPDSNCLWRRSKMAQRIMRVAHLLRKYNPAQWGGTETAVKQLLDGLRNHGVSSVVSAPKCQIEWTEDPFQKAGHPVKRYAAFAPVTGISAEQRAQLIAMGGNLMSFELIWQL